MSPHEKHNPAFGEHYHSRSHRPVKARTTTTLLPVGKVRAHKRKIPSKLVFLAIAGAWCFLSVSILTYRLSIEEGNDPSILPSEKVDKKSPTIPHNWEPTRALQLLRKEFQPPFGLVMRDLSRRVLSRHVANSNVLVIAPDAVEAMSMPIPRNLDSTDYDATLLSLGGTFVLHANDQGHATHAMNAGLKINGEWNRWNTTLDTWWTSFEDSPEKRRPNWILLAVMDPGLAWEDVVWSDSQRFLQESTVTYVVTAVRSRLLPNSTLEVYGMQGFRALTEKRYKMQVLQISHHLDRYGPNALLKEETDVTSLLQRGAESAKRYCNATSPIFTAFLFGTQGLDLAIPSRREYMVDAARLRNKQINLYKPVQLQLCPKSSKQVSLELDFAKTNGRSHIEVILWNFSGMWGKLVPPFSRWTSSRWTRPGILLRSNYHGIFAKQPLSDSRRIETHFETKDLSLQVWYDHQDTRLTEAACVRFDKMVRCKTRVLAANPETLGRSRHRSQLGAKVEHGATNGFDLLVIMLDPMSRGHLQRSMPQTIAVLHELEFLQFTKYSAVGDNSGPNQAALYSGKPLSDRDGISKNGNDSEWLWDILRKAGYVTLKGEDGCIENSNMLQSLKPNTTHGEALNQMFCFDFNRPNCLGPEPAASYLLQYGTEFVDTYGSAKDGPPWAAFLHFVDSHEDTMTLSTLLDSLLADFLRKLYESGKLSNALVVLLSDHGLHYGPYFQTLSGRRERTEPLLYMRTPSQVRESLHGRTMEANAGLWTTPFDVHQTMLDMTVGRDAMDKSESLITELPDARKFCRGASAIPERFCAIHDIFQGVSQTTEACPKTPQVPSILSFYADIPKNNRPMLVAQKCSATEGLPFDFTEECICGTSHHDIYPCKEHPWGPEGINSTQRAEEYFAVVKCKNRVERLDNRMLRRQFFIDRYHSAQNVTHDEQQTSSAALSKSSIDDTTTSRSPDILVLELDSVSKSHADRHLPLTRQFLKSHTVLKDESGILHCTNGVCAFDFSRFAVVGPNSIANQVAALSGCIVSRFHENCFKQTYPSDKCLEQGLFGAEDGCAACPAGTFPIDPLSPCNTTKGTPEQCCTASYPGWNSTRICQDASLFEHNMQLFRRGPRRHTTWCPTVSKNVPSKSTPWLFDFARSEGYITYFAEEFCYDYSPYVTQDNTFPLHTDFELRKVHCLLQSMLKKCEGPWPPMGPHLCLEHEHENPAFSQISAIWEAYPDVPKFAFLNGIAAHDYSFEWIKMISSLEAYDEQLASFLERIVSSKEFENTIIVVRTDHGLQGGPSTVDYSLQVEHREPWTQLVIPKALAGESLPLLAQNQDRLATGYDLYHSLRGIMSSMDAAPIPDWSYNLFKSIIPKERSCKKAKIPIDFCPCDGVGLDRAPHFGICNVYEEYNDLFCASNQDKPILPKVPEYR